MSERQAKQIIVLNMSGQSFDKRFHLRLRGYDVVELSYLEDLLNWLGACEKNSVDVGCIVVIDYHADPLFKLLCDKAITLIFVDMQQADRQAFDTQSTAHMQSIIEYCSYEGLVDQIDQCIIASAERGDHG